MYEVKIHKSERNRKKQNKRNSQGYNCITPPKYTQKNSIHNTVARWQKKMGYDFECPEDQVNPMLREMKQEFEDKAVKYCGGGHVFRKKMTRFDKMMIKEQTGFKLQQMPIRKKFRRADQIVENLMKKQALFALFKCR